jgi:hypothetical protein
MLDLSAQRSIQYLYLCQKHHRLYLNIFRGEPAISRFDWHFTPYHKSSRNFATLPSSALPLLLHSVQPAHGKLTGFRVYVTQTTSPYSDSLSLRLRDKPLSLACISKLVGAFCKRHAVTTLRQLRPLGSNHGFSSISLPSPGFFSPFPHGTCSLSIMFCI